MLMRRPVHTRVAMCMVSMTSFLEPVQEGNNRDARIGIVFILLSCVVQGSQYVFEEKVSATHTLAALREITCPLLARPCSCCVLMVAHVSVRAGDDCGQRPSTDRGGYGRSLGYHPHATRCIPMGIYTARYTHAQHQRRAWGDNRQEMPCGPHAWHVTFTRDMSC